MIIAWKSKPKVIILDCKQFSTCYEQLICMFVSYVILTHYSNESDVT